MKFTMNTASILATGLAVTMMLGLTSCGTGNRQNNDNIYNFNRGIIKLPDGKIVSGDVESWRDYNDSDAIQVTIDGTTYYTYVSNVVLIHDKGVKKN